MLGTIQGCKEIAAIEGRHKWLVGQLDNMFTH
jgi:hypothetical protein